MKLKGSIDVAAPPTAVFALIVDPVSLSACVPGVQELRQVDPSTFAGSITAAIGPMEGQFSFTSVLETADFPELRVRVEGLDSVTKSRLEALVHATVRSSDPAGVDAEANGRPAAAVDAGATTLDYDATVTVKGRLAILGEMVLRATASLMITQVTRCLRTRLETGDGAASSGAAVGR